MDVTEGSTVDAALDSLALAREKLIEAVEWLYFRPEQHAEVVHLLRDVQLLRDELLKVKAVTR